MVVFEVNVNLVLEKGVNTWRNGTMSYFMFSINTGENGWKCIQTVPNVAHKDLISLKTRNKKLCMKNRAVQNLQFWKIDGAPNLMLLYIFLYQAE